MTGRSPTTVGTGSGRAVLPDRTGTAVRDGVRLAWEVHGEEHEPTVLLMPSWSIVRSRLWKAQVGFLSRHYRVVTFDGRGSGDSDRPEGAAAYTDEQYAADTVAVMDATGTDRAVLVGLSLGATWSIHVAAGWPDRVTGVVMLAASPHLAEDEAGERKAPAFDDHLDSHEGWAKYNKHYWLDGDYPDFVDFFMSQLFQEPHSTKQREDGVGWGLEVPPAVLAATVAAEDGLDGTTRTPLEPLAAQVRCPVLSVHGTHDRISGLRRGRRIAELTGARLVVLEGAGHGPMARHPVRTNHLIRDFVESLRPVAERVEESAWVAAPHRPRRVLYLSSPIGLGHAMRDLAVVEELRKRVPDVEVQWLAQHPVTAVLERAGEQVHPASRFLANESGHIEHESGEHDLHAFHALRTMDEILVHNFMVFSEVVEQEHYDLVVGDEAWDVDYFLHENPELKRFAFAWMTDFVGFLPMPDGGDREARLTADLNAEMLEQRARFARVRDRSVFVGNPEDVVPESFGPGLPMIRDWVRDNFDFAGYVTGFDPAAYADRSAVRHRLGYADDRRLCVVTVGGSGVGQPLLRRVLDAVPLVRRQQPDIHFLVVAGPRIDPASLPRRRGVTVRGHVPGLFEHLAASDLAVVQGGLTTTMELTATRRPFLYVPLRHHFEQTFHVRHRLDRYAAGRCLDWAEAVDPDGLAAAVLTEIGTEPASRPVEADGAARAAGMLAELL